MKKYIALALAILCILSLMACGKEESEDSAEECTFQATVLEVHQTYLLVEPAEGSWERTSADQITVSLRIPTPWPTPQVGDTVNVVYNGELLETYPAQIGKLYRIEIIN